MASLRDRLLDNSGHDKVVGIRLGGIGEDAPVVLPLNSLVLAGPCPVLNRGIERLYACHINVCEHIHIVEDIAELFLKKRFLIARHRKTRELRHVLHVLFLNGLGHICSLFHPLLTFSSRYFQRHERRFHFKKPEKFSKKYSSTLAKFDRVCI